MYATYDPNSINWNYEFLCNYFLDIICNNLFIWLLCLDKAKQFHQSAYQRIKTTSLVLSNSLCLPFFSPPSPSSLFFCFPVVLRVSFPWLPLNDGCNRLKTITLIPPLHTYTHYLHGVTAIVLHMGMCSCEKCLSASFWAHSHKHDPTLLLTPMKNIPWWKIPPCMRTHFYPHSSGSNSQRQMVFPQCCHYDLINCM